MNSNSSTDCPLCGSPSRETLSRKILLHVCEGCGFVFKDPRHHPDPETEKRRYELHSSVPGEEYARNIKVFVESAVLPYVKNGDALDFGCGRIGLLGRILKENGFAVSEYDPYFRDDPASLDRTYDLVTAVEVVEHFQDPLREFAMLSGLLKKGGILAIATQFAGLDLSGWWYLRDITHQSFYTEEAFRVIARINGCSIRFSDHRTLITFEKR